MNTKFSFFFKTSVTIVALICFSMFGYGQKARAAAKTGASKPAVTQIDEIGLKKLLIPHGKPLLVNFWATWCDPCREEFPELVKINADYKGKIDFITISLDDLSDIGTEVPKFLIGMKADMPAYLLKTADEDAAMRSVSTAWAGGLPFTILFGEDGSTAYFRQGKVRPDILRMELSKATSPMVTK
ncbi:MAG: thioredoxin domain-containing protein [Pyrinomonadaceae bacterium]